MHRHDKVREILKVVISEVDYLEAHEYNDERKRSKACEHISDDIHKALLLINDIKKEFEEKI